jgi:hypothetical protein
MIVINAARLRTTNLFKLNPLVQRKKNHAYIITGRVCVHCARIYIAGNASKLAMAREVGVGKKCFCCSFCRNEALTMPCWRTPAVVAVAAQRHHYQILGGAAPVLPWRRHAPMLPQAAAQATPPLLQPDLLLSLLPASWSGLACTAAAKVAPVAPPVELERSRDACWMLIRSRIELRKQYMVVVLPKLKAMVCTYSMHAES